VIRLRSIVKKYGRIKALDEISLDIPLGRITVILGSSGSGKTTLLRIIAGLEKPDQGRIFIGDRDVTDLPPWDRGVSMVFQTPSLFPHLTVEENIGFGLEAHGYSGDVVRERVEWAMELLHIGHLKGKYPDQLSGGEQQRVALARALVLKPNILLLDEPLSNLDLALREELRIELKNLQRKLGTTFIHVTHDQDEALELADYLVILYNGRVVEYGDPLEVYERPKNIRTAMVFGHNVVDVCIYGENIIFPWSMGRENRSRCTCKAVIPQHRIEIVDGSECVVVDKLYRRNYGIVLARCNDHLLKIAVNIDTLDKIVIGKRIGLNIHSKYISIV